MTELEAIELTDSKRTSILAILQALFVTVLWSSSFVIIKFGLEEIPPLTFAGLRYSIASMTLLFLMMSQPKMRAATKSRSRRWWGMLVLYGIVYITGTQGTQFLGLYYLPAITFSLILNMTPIIVVLMAIPWLGEKPSLIESILILLGIFGVLLYFYPLDFIGVSIVGLIVAVTSLMANSFSSIIGRAINRTRDTPALVVTGIMMSVGSIFLMVFGLLTEPIAPLSLTSWFYILWLAVLNTALAFTLWNRAMQSLRAIDMTLINSTMMPQIVILSVFFLGEYPNYLDWIGLILLAISVAAVQVIQASKTNNKVKKNNVS
ncbi:MAG: DMT family transporter [Candidatus Thorarchaeota archaeon]